MWFDFLECDVVFFFLIGERLVRVVGSYLLSIEFLYNNFVKKIFLNIKEFFFNNKIKVSMFFNVWIIVCEGFFY